MSSVSDKTADRQRVDMYLCAETVEKDLIAAQNKLKTIVVSMNESAAKSGDSHDAVRCDCRAAAVAWRIDGIDGLIDGWND